MKKVLLIVAFCTSLIGTAQNLESKIPNNAEAVVSISGDRLLELISIAEFDNYKFAKEMFNELGVKKDSTNTIASIKDFGFDVGSKAYYFYQKNDSIGYHNMIIGLTNKDKFEKLLSKKEKETIERQNGINISVDNSSVTVWNGNMLVLTVGDKSYNYFKDNEERFKAQAENEDESYYQIEKRIVKGWTKENALSIFNDNAGRSIVTNKSYLDSKDKDAAASAWVRNYGQLISKTMAGLYGVYGLNSFMKPDAELYGFKSVGANLFFDTNAARMNMEMEVSSEWQKIFKKIYNSKMDKDFFTYFDQNEALAYMSISMDVQATFEEYPALLTSLYGGMLPNYKQEMDLGGEFLSLLLDEEAIGELMTGDMLFVLNDIGEEEVEYTSYEYDDDYKKKEIKKTKKEVMPDFTIMIGSKKGKLLNKAALLGVKYKLFENKAGYYRIDVPKSEIPFDLYTAVKNDILFFTTSEKKISNIINNRMVGEMLVSTKK